MQITFWGAVETVTGSMHELHADGKRYVLDCGLFQGRRRESRERNTGLPFPGESVDAVILSHAHIDHSGNLPSLVKYGFHGPIWATRATADLCRTMLPDSGYIQEKDAMFVNKRRHRKRVFDPKAEVAEVEPLYTVADVERTLPLFEEVAYRSVREIGDQLTWEAYDAGHLLGSAAVVVESKTNGRTLRLAFSGDVGRRNLPIIRDPRPLPTVDYLIVESTYGDRLHKQEDVVVDKLARVVRRTAERGGRIVVPAFAVGRTQQLVLMLHQLCEAGKIPAIPIFVDSPLAVNATEVYRRHTECFDEETNQFLWDGSDPFGFDRLRYVRDVQESKALNDYHGPFIVISASGMCEVGRILHHLRNNIEDPRNTVLITGFQAAHTLGRKIVDRWAEVPIFGEPMRLRAEVVTLNELSGHADQHELLDWMKPMAATLKKVFLVHGEPAQSRALAAMIRQRYGVEAVVPSRGETFELS
ncbi:MAG: MBL fold metallo-hydrolase [bacterium]|nr:MBL fold metallo-hydrolase [bacterium]